MAAERYLCAEANDPAADTPEFGHFGPLLTSLIRPRTGGSGNALRSIITGWPDSSRTRVRC
ncbi:MAG TPA: hypothetical protein VG268_06535 [Streptosporangiaceae bacterium]|nr:hypothetical protein [Streptosporangiaceae bacterium]